MARLTAADRRQIKSSDFALHENGKDEYPIENATHARDALAMVAAHGTPHEQAVVRAAVRRHYPGIKISGGKK
jgi:hypothetical protein